MMIGYFILSSVIYSPKKYHEDQEVRLLTGNLVPLIGSTSCNYNALPPGVFEFSLRDLSDVIFWCEKR